MQNKKEPPYAFRLCKHHLDEIKKVMQEAQDGQKTSPTLAFLDYYGYDNPIILTQATCSLYYCDKRGAVARIELEPKGVKDGTRY